MKAIAAGEGEDDSNLTEKIKEKIKIFKDKLLEHKKRV